MSTSKHTPGPWTAGETHASASPTPCIGKCGTVATVWGIGPEHDANVRLIAAAPELLDVLRKAAEWVDQQGNYPGCRPAADCMLNAIRTVIAKAEGTDARDARPSTASTMTIQEAERAGVERIAKMRAIIDADPRLAEAAQRHMEQTMSRDCPATAVDWVNERGSFWRKPITAEAIADFLKPWMDLEPGATGYRITYVDGRDATMLGTYAAGTADEALEAMAKALDWGSFAEMLDFCGNTREQYTVEAVRG